MFHTAQHSGTTQVGAGVVKAARRSEGKADWECKASSSRFNCIMLQAWRSIQVASWVVNAAGGWGFEGLKSRGERKADPKQRVWENCIALGSIQRRAVALFRQLSEGAGAVRAWQDWQVRLV